MKLHHLHPAEGSKKERTRVGRGRAGARGKTAGRGTKGTGARKNVPAYFEGGQMPLPAAGPQAEGVLQPEPGRVRPGQRRGAGQYFDGEVSPAELYAHGLAHKGAKVKVLGRGEIDKALTVKAHAFSATAKAKIEAAGGTTETLVRRPSREGQRKGRLAGRAEGVPQLVPGAGSSKQDPLHAIHHRALPAGEPRPGAGRRHERPGEPGARRVPRPVVAVLRGRHRPLLGVLARDHALHHQLDHHPADDGGDPQARPVAGPGRGGDEEDQPDHPLRHGRAGVPAVGRARVPVPQRREPADPRPVHGARLVQADERRC